MSVMPSWYYWPYNKHDRHWNKYTFIWHNYGWMKCLTYVGCWQLSQQEWRKKGFFTFLPSYRPYCSPTELGSCWLLLKHPDWGSDQDQLFLPTKDLHFPGRLRIKWLLLFESPIWGDTGAGVLPFPCVRKWIGAQTYANDIQLYFLSQLRLCRCWTNVWRM